ncbi:MAG: thiamine pyrophosphate-binding protein [Deltaproteobacteria bacterium]|nr:thiamine pyrophosphate-binding protein [Deltaproteobacteria bacterium]
MPTAAEAIIETLKEEGVKVVFGIPSIHNIALYEALRQEPSIRHILCRHETTAAHMADGYARTGQGLGVVLASTGPGSGYMVPALQEAWWSCSPLLMITTNISSSDIGQGLGVLHELDGQDMLFKNVTKVTVVVRTEDGIRAMTRNAVRTALSERTGPVYLEVPTDLLDRPVSDGTERVGKTGHRKEASPDIEKAISLLGRARQPIIIAGISAVRAGIGPDITTLSETLAAPVITTTQGKGIIPEDHPHAFGNAARKGALRKMVQSCDLVLAIGTRLREVDAKRHGLQLPQLIHVDWDRRWINRNFPTEVSLVGDIPSIVRELVDRIGPVSSLGQREKWIKEMRKRVEQELLEIRETRKELHYLEVIRRMLPREGVLVIDSTLLGFWAEYFYPSYRPGGLISARGSSIIGFGFPAAIGVRLACPGRPVIAVTGDGGFLYGAQELATCIRHQVGFPVIVVNDNAFGVIGYLQRKAYQREYESRLTNPDFNALARAFGAQAIRVDSPAGLGEAIKEALSSEALWVIELKTSFPEPPLRY